MTILLYLLALAGANVATAELTPIFTTFLGEPVVITAGTFFIGALFFLRDAVQIKHGVKAAYAAIGAALLLNLALSMHYDDLFWITVASGLALLVSEVSDTVVFTRYHGRIGPRILASGAVSTPLDSILFVVVGLSPLTTGIVPWEAVFATILLQSLLKFGMQVLAAIPVWRLRAAA